MIVFAETNLVLELVRLQEEVADCERLLQSSEAGEIRLILPAYSLVEPIDTLKRAQLRRLDLAHQVRKELDLIRRSRPYAGELQLVEKRFRESSDAERLRFNKIRNRLLATARIIPLDLEILTEAAGLQERFEMPAGDCIVLSSVLWFLRRGESTSPSCFLTRDRHFVDPQIARLLDVHGCQLIPSFVNGLRYVQRAIGQNDPVEEADD